MIPYGRQFIDEADIQSVVDVLQSDWLTTGPGIEVFETEFAKTVGSRYAVAVSSGTAALHCAMFALGITSGDEVIVTPMTFAATANCIVYQGGVPVFADVLPDTLLIDPEEVEKKITSKTKAIIAVDYAGQPCNWDALKQIAHDHGLWLVADSCHALGATYHGLNVGTLADLSTFSFHPVKHITTGEGGMITTDNEGFAGRMRLFRNHGITTDHHQRERLGSWAYEMVDLGFNYRITDFQCALGLSQLNKLPLSLQRRSEIATKYDGAFALLDGVSPLEKDPEITHAYHLYVIKLAPKIVLQNREQIFHELRSRRIGVNVHYIPVHLHPYYQKRWGTGPGDCPRAEMAYEQILSLPMYPGLTEGDVEFVIEQIHSVLNV
ncbi:UDP-4-amino-4,6-dideoxy-N-acetyl-beta-L-altrosamine transaminase [Desulfocicer niacini]